VNAYEGKTQAWRKVMAAYRRWMTYKEIGKEAYLYSVFIQRLFSMRSDIDHKILPANYTMSAFLS